MRVKTPRNIWPLCLFLVTCSYCQATVHQLDRIGLGAVDGGRDAGEQQHWISYLALFSNFVNL